VGELRSIEQRIAEAERRWPGLTFKRTGNEAHSPCPRCGGNDRFVVFEDGGFWCRQCAEAGWLDDNVDHKPTERELTEIRLRRLEYQQAEQHRRLTLLEQMHASTDHVRYWHNMQARVEAIEYWCNEGMELQTIDDYQLGYCPRCPTDMQGRPSYTIPVLAYGKLWNIRHRLIGAPDGDKYRPHVAGLPAMLFNADYLSADHDAITIVEGEKKSIVAAQTGFPNVGLMGKSGFKPEWVGKFARFKTVYVALDPDALDRAAEIAGLFKARGRVVYLYDKLDDMIVKHGATREDVEWCLQQGRTV
jgi:hypothetical protein